jgi:hypothetical protein
MFNKVGLVINKHSVINIQVGTIKNESLKKHNL